MTSVRPMRVAHLITRMVVGGAQENTLSSVLGLRKLGWTVDLVAGPPTGSEGSLEDRIPVDLLTRISELVRPVSPWKDLVAIFKLTQWLRQRMPTVVHTHSGKAGLVGRIAAERANVPIIVHTVHGPSFGPFQGEISNGSFRLAERWAAQMTDHFVVVADAMAQQYQRAGIGQESDYSLIYSGFDLDPFLRPTDVTDLRLRWGIQSDDFVIGKIARITDLKGHHDLLTIAPDVWKQVPRAKFLLVGDGQLRSEFEAEIIRRGWKDRMVITGLVPPTEVPRYVKLMDCLVHLSLREGLPRALPQALASGIPVIAYDCDGASEVCRTGETGLLVAPNDREGIANGLISLALDHRRRQSLGSQGQEWVRSRFSVETMVGRLDTLYRDLMDGRISKARDRSIP